MSIKNFNHFPKLALSLSIIIVSPHQGLSLANKKTKIKAEIGTILIQT